MRHNVFDKKGLAGLIKALEESMCLKHLKLESMAIHMPEARLLSAFILRKDCEIEELELNEADIGVEELDLIMEALYKADHLKRLSLAKNELSVTIC